MTLQSSIFCMVVQSSIFIITIFSLSLYSPVSTTLTTTHVYPSYLSYPLTSSTSYLFYLSIFPLLHPLSLLLFLYPLFDIGIISILSMINQTFVQVIVWLFWHKPHLKFLGTHLIFMTDILLLIFTILVTNFFMWPSSKTDDEIMKD